MKHPLHVVVASFFIAMGILLFLAVLANAQPQHDHSALGVAGAFYAGWNQMPDRTNSCCDQKDCYYTVFKSEGGSTYALKRRIINDPTDIIPGYHAPAVVLRESVEMALKHAEWVTIPAEKLEENAADPKDSPDGQNHVCMNEYGLVYCAVRGGGQ